MIVAKWGVVQMGCSLRLQELAFIVIQTTIMGLPTNLDRLRTFVSNKNVPILVNRELRLFFVTKLIKLTRINVQKHYK